MNEVMYKSVMLPIAGQEGANIHKCLQHLAIYGQVAVKCRLLSHVAFEMAGFESRLILYIKL